MSERRKRIKAAFASVERATVKANKAIRAIQAKCPHATVLRRPSGVTGYQYIENSWFPAVLVCVDCGLVEEKDRMTPIYNTYETKQSRLKCEPVGDIDEQKLGKLRVNLMHEAAAPN